MSKCFPMSEPWVLKHSKTVVFDETTFLENYCFLIHSILTQRVAMNKLLLQINRNIYPTLLLDTLQFFVSYETSEIEVFRMWSTLRHNFANDFSGKTLIIRTTKSGSFFISPSLYSLFPLRILNEVLQKSLPPRTPFASRSLILPYQDLSILFDF